MSATIVLWLSQFPLATGQPDAKLEPGATKRVEIADGVFMEFCFIPPGEAKLGSGTEEERNAVLKAWKEEDAEFGNEPKWLKWEATENRGTFKSKGFWLGKYEVTQEEWKAVMGVNPSFYRPAGKNEGLGRQKIGRKLADVKNPSRLPVDSVRASDCEDFLAKINKRPQLAKMFGKSAKFVLPHEDEWEYAYRGGKGNTQPFYWGEELNGTQANCSGKIPFGTDKKGPYLDRPCEVDDTNMKRYEVHPWGLVHMSGNVWEWCENKNTLDRRMVCGGSWASVAWNCRAASRRFIGQFVGASLDTMTYGFRVCIRLE